MDFKLKKISFVVGLSICMSAPIHSLSLRDFTDSIYSSFTTSGSPDNFRSASGQHVFTGGAASLRFNVRDISVISFSPPSAGASCSGIDMFAGSIKFASRDEVIQLGRNIAAAATAYAFRLALTSVCSTCASIMTSLQAWIGKLNQLANLSCNNMLTAMENAKPSSGPKETKEWDGILFGVDGFADPESFMKKESTKNWMETMGMNGLNLTDLAKSNSSVLTKTTDIGFLIAYNTLTYTFLFPWMDEDKGRKSTWSVLSEGQDCPDEASEEPGGKWCAIKPEWKHSYSSFIMGNEIGDKDDKEELNLPECSNVKIIRLDDDRKFTTCDFETTPPVKRSSGTVSSISSQIFRDVFGTEAIKADGSVDFTGANGVCRFDMVNTASDSMFAKSLRFSDSGTTDLTSSQAFVASILGTAYSRDLYRMNAAGTVISSLDQAKITSCGVLANLVHKRTETIVEEIRSNAQHMIGLARLKILQNPKLRNGLSEEFDRVLLKFEARMLGNGGTYKAREIRKQEEARVVPQK